MPGACLHTCLSASSYSTFGPESKQLVERLHRDAAKHTVRTGPTTPGPTDRSCAKVVPGSLLADGASARAVWRTFRPESKQLEERLQCDAAKHTVCSPTMHVYYDEVKHRVVFASTLVTAIQHAYKWQCTPAAILARNLRCAYACVCVSCHGACAWIGRGQELSLSQ